MTHLQRIKLKELQKAKLFKLLVRSDRLNNFDNDLLHRWSDKVRELHYLNTTQEV